jgi:hypothetical protein
VRKRKENCASRFEAKKAAMLWEMRDCTGTGYQRLLYSSTVLFWLFREINGDKVATNIILVF